MKSTKEPENDIGKQRGKDMNWNLSSNESKTAQEKKTCFMYDGSNSPQTEDSYAHRCFETHAYLFKI